MYIHHLLDGQFALWALRPMIRPHVCNVDAVCSAELTVSDRLYHIDPEHFPDSHSVRQLDGRRSHKCFYTRAIQRCGALVSRQSRQEIGQLTRAFSRPTSRFVHVLQIAEPHFTGTSHRACRGGVVVPKSLVVEQRQGLALLDRERENSSRSR